MVSNQSCSTKSYDLAGVEIVCLQPQDGVPDYNEAVALAVKEAEKRFDEFMLLSWYDRDRDFESPPNTSECAGSGKKEGYIHYALSRGAKLMVDVEEGRFVFFYYQVEW